MSRKTRTKKLWLLPVVLLLLLISAAVLLLLTCDLLRFIGAPGPLSDVLFKRPGAIHILGSKDELWMFVEIKWMVRYADPTSSPRVINIAHEQYVLSYAREGWRPPVKINSPHGPAFHTNISRILISRGELFLIAESGFPTHTYFYRWDGNAFTRLNDAQTREIKQRISYVENTSVLANAEAIDAETIRSGWKVLYRDDEPFFMWNDPICDYQDPQNSEVRFQWNGAEFVMTGSNRTPVGVFTIRRGNDPPHDLFKFDATETYLSSAEYRRLANKEKP